MPMAAAASTTARLLSMKRVFIITPATLEPILDNRNDGHFSHLRV
jgi:hypothetical protein